MIRSLTTVVLLGATAAACVAVGGLDQRTAGAEERARAYAFCKSLGVRAGTDAYALCRMRIAESMSSDEFVWRRVVGDKAALDKAVQQGVLAKP